VLSGSGQKAVTKDGYFAMPYVMSQEDRAKLGLSN
jgi:hypothetical protein